MVTAAALTWPAHAQAQRLIIDPDWRIWARDSREHLAAGAGIDVAAQLVLPKSKTWQRLAIVGTIALAYELGQESTSRSAGVHGRGYGLGPKDWAMGMAGAALLELVFPKRRRRS